MNQMTSTWGDTAEVTNTDTNNTVTGEVHHFKHEDWLSVVLNRAVKIDLRFNPRNKLYIGSKGGMEFWSEGPKEYVHNDTRR